MQMTDKEIAHRFERNGRSDEHIRILAELNGTNMRTIVDILNSQGYYTDSKHHWQKREKQPEDSFMRRKRSLDSAETATTKRKDRAIITQETINLIVNLYKAGYSQKDIAKEADVSTMTVARYIKKLGVTRGFDQKSEINSNNSELLNKILSPIDQIINELEAQLESLKQAREKVVEAFKN